MPGAAAPPGKLETACRGLSRTPPFLRDAKTGAYLLCDLRYPQVAAAAPVLLPLCDGEFIAASVRRNP